MFVVFRPLHTVLFSSEFITPRQVWCASLLFQLLRRWRQEGGEFEASQEK
jgi:hypothetical protein